jgi:hypothetical protein
MTKRSYFWTCVNVGDGGPDAFSQEAVMTLLGMISNTAIPETMGVFPWTSTNVTISNLLGLGEFDFTGEFEPTLDGTTLTILPGIGISGGIFLLQNSEEVYDLTTQVSGVGNAVDRVVIRRSIGDQTARLTYLPGSALVPAAQLRHDETYWDVPICRVFLDGDGDFNGTIVDDRVYVGSPSSSTVILQQTIINNNLTNFLDLTVPTVYNKIRLEIRGSLESFGKPLLPQFYVTLRNITSNVSPVRADPPIGLQPNYTTKLSYWRRDIQSYQHAYFEDKLGWRLAAPDSRDVTSPDPNNPFHFELEFVNPPKVNPGGSPNAPVAYVKFSPFTRVNMSFPSELEYNGQLYSWGGGDLDGPVDNFQLRLETNNATAMWFAQGTIITLYGIK